MADIFFDRFVAAVSAPPVETAPAAAVEATGETLAPMARPALSVLDVMPREPFGLPRVAWVGLVIYLFILILVIGSLL